MTAQGAEGSGEEVQPEVEHTPSAIAPEPNLPARITVLLSGKCSEKREHLNKAVRKEIY